MKFSDGIINNINLNELKISENCDNITHIDFVDIRQNDNVAQVYET